MKVTVLILRFLAALVFLFASYHFFTLAFVASHCQLACDGNDVLFFGLVSVSLLALGACFLLWAVGD